MSNLNKIIYYSDFDVNLSKNALNNDVIKKTNTQAVEQSLKLLFLTKFYTKLWRPQIGSYIDTFLFSQAHEYEISIIKDEIENLITQYEPRIIINNLEVFFKNIESRDTGILNIRMEYTIVDIGTIEIFNFSVDRLR